MNYTSVRLEIEERIAVVTIDRADRRNALDDTTVGEMNQLFTLLNRNTAARVVVLTGAGAAFCSGMDIEYLRRMADSSQEANVEDARQLMRLLLQIANLRKPVIAMVNGPALGGGCGLAAASDFVFASRQKAKLGVPEVRLGFVPAVILAFLVKRMGEAAAKEFVLRGEVLEAEEARSRGLVTSVVDDQQLRPTVMEFARTLAASTSPSSITLTKELFARFDEMGKKDALDYAASLNALARKTEDFKKGMESFLKKEKLQW